MVCCAIWIEKNEQRRKLGSAAWITWCIMVFRELSATLVNGQEHSNALMPPKMEFRLRNNPTPRPSTQCLHKWQALIKNDTKNAKLNVLFSFLPLSLWTCLFHWLEMSSWWLYCYVPACIAFCTWLLCVFDFGLCACVFHCIFLIQHVHSLSAIWLTNGCGTKLSVNIIA